MKPKLYHGNLSDLPLFSLEQEGQSYWVELSRTHYDESTHTATKEKMVQAFHVNEFDTMMSLEQNHGISWLKAAGWHRYEVLHDPTVKFDLKDLKL